MSCSSPPARASGPRRGGLGDVRQRKLRRPVGKHEPVGFLVRIGELRVTEAGKYLQLSNDLQEFAVAARELFGRAATGIPPGYPLE